MYDHPEPDHHTRHKQGSQGGEKAALFDAHVVDYLHHDEVVAADGCFGHLGGIGHALAVVF